MHCCCVCLKNCGKPRNLVMASGLRFETGSYKRRSRVTLGIFHWTDESKCYSNSYLVLVQGGPLVRHSNFADSHILIIALIILVKSENTQDR